MKFLVLLFLIGAASASFYDALNQASNDVVVDFLIGMESTPSLRQALDSFEYADAAEEIDNDIKTELGKTLKESLDSILEKIRVTVDHGKQVSADLVEKAKELTQKLKELGLDAGDKAKDLFGRIKEKASSWLRDLLNKIGIGKRGINDMISSLIERLNINSLLENLKSKIAEKVNVSAIRDYIKKVFGEASVMGQNLLNLLKTRGVQAIRDLVAKILPGQLGGSDYSLVNIWENIKGLFKDLGAKAKEHFSTFTTWLRQTVKGGFDNAKDKASKLKELAKEVLDHSKSLSKEAAREALEFFEPYKNDLGALWEQLKDTVKRVVGTA